MPKLESIQKTIKVFADTASLADIADAIRLPFVRGVTTNPSLIRKAGVDDYPEFVRLAISLVGDLPISFEVIADSHEEMQKQAMWLSEQGPNVYVKIPVMNTKGESTLPLVKELCEAKIKLNVTAVFTFKQIDDFSDVLSRFAVPSILSVFAGRIADTGRDCTEYVRYAYSKSHQAPIAVLWASAREVYNVIQARDSGAHIITLFPEFIRKMVALLDKDLNQFSLETVRMFYDDAVESGLDLKL